MLMMLKPLVLTGLEELESFVYGTMPGGSILTPL